MIIVIHLMLVLALIGVVLLQRSEGGGLGIGGGGGGGFMSSRGTANMLTRATAILAGLFFVTSLVLSILAGFNRKPTSIIQGGQSAPTAPGAPAPLGSGSGGLLNQLQRAHPRRRRPLRRDRRCRSRSERLQRGAGKPALRRFGRVQIGGPVDLLSKNVKVEMQVSAIAKDFQSTHRRRAALRFSRSSN